MPTEKKVEVSIAGDYAVMKTGDLYFYYGYEFVWCNSCSTFAEYPAHLDCDTDWAFQVKKNGKDFWGTTAASAVDKFECAEQLLHGIGRFLAMKEKS